MTPWLAIVGIGEDGASGLSDAARAAIAEARLVVGGARHLALAASLIRGETLAWPHPIADALPAIAARRGTPVAVLASGDPNWFGIAATLRRTVPAAETRCLPAPSSFALACAHLGWSLQETETLSACGRPLEAVVPALSPDAKLLVLSADAGTPAALAALLRARGFGQSTLHVMEALGGKRARVRTLRANDDMPSDIDPLNLVAIEARGASGLPRAAGLPDDLFEHDGQITKREVRAITLAALAPRAGEMLWDVGCGSGSVGIEWCLAHPRNRAVALDRRTDRAERAGRNARALCAVHWRAVVGEAPDALDGLPAPDAIFVGGGLRVGLLDVAWAALRPGGRLVANAVTIESQALLIDARARLGGTLTRIAIERLDAIGPALHGMRPAMAVLQFAAERT